MSYLVLARKWRPQSFDDLVGQEHVSRTLANAIASERVAHAFLFTGVRGVGKTTTARISAKALNCATGPTASPCQKCPACSEIPEGQDVDVLEIDGASYNGVDEVRRLQESLPYRPARDRFKIYIVDEVHMLSNAAWNAFLKTLEEPPPHVKFIFATTEVHKVPATILSRCQRYDFKLIGARDIAARLRHVLEAEKVAADDQALAILAREAAGSMRDAMSLLDQVIAWAGGSTERLGAEEVSRVLGVAARSVLHRLGEAVLAGEAGRAVQIVAELSEQGFSLANVAKDLLSHLRDLVVAKVCPEPGPLVSLADSELANLLGLAARSDTDDLCRLYLGFSRAYDDIARSGQPRAALEMALVRLSRRPPLVPLDELLDRLGRLERRLGGAADDGAAPSGRASGGPPTRPSPRPEPARDERARRPALRPEPPAEPPRGERGGRAAAREPSGDPSRGARPASWRRGEGQSHGEPDDEPSEPPGAPEPRGPMPGPSAARPPDAPSAPEPVTAESAAESDAPRVEPWTEDALGSWRAILGALGADRPGIASVYEHGAPLDLRPGRVVLGYAPGSFLAERAADEGALGLLAAVASAHFGCETTVELDTSGRHEGVPTVAAIAGRERAARLEEARRNVAARPLVRAALELLGAELREIRLPERGA